MGEHKGETPVDTKARDAHIEKILEAGMSYQTRIVIYKLTKEECDLEKQMMKKSKKEEGRKAREVE